MFSNLCASEFAKPKALFSRGGSDYLFYSLIDAVVDNYFVVLEGLGEQIEDVEDKLLKEPQPEVQQNIHYLKRELIFLRRSVWPLRELVNSLSRDESSLIKKNTPLLIPLTFIAVIYGMNFNPEISPFNMSELNTRFGYIAAWAVMILTAAAMVLYFKRKKWL